MGDLERMGAATRLFGGVVQRNMLLGILLFIVSEVMIFFAMFWAFFHASLNPDAAVGGVWPPVGLEVLEWWH
jgi:heme/copper-type cytochrome/quinol oxidase subunit 3